MDSNGAAVASGILPTESVAVGLRGPSQNGAAEAREIRTRNRGSGSGVLTHAQLGAVLLQQVSHGSGKLDIALCLRPLVP